MIERRKMDPAEHHDALSLLLRVTDEQGQGMPMQLLRDEVMTLLLAGHDTTSNRAVTWTWVLLAQHPEVFEALRAEVSAREEGTQCPVVPLYTQGHQRIDAALASSLSLRASRIAPRATGSLHNPQG